MAEEGYQIAAAAHAAQSNLPAYSSAADILPELAACFALVRPVSMTDATAAEWLAVAANELAGYEVNRLKAGLAVARRTCTHHGQIIPCVFENMKYPWDMGKPLKRQLPNSSTKALPSPVKGLVDSAAKALSARR